MGGSAARFRITQRAQCRLHAALLRNGICPSLTQPISTIASAEASLLPSPEASASAAPATKVWFGPQRNITVRARPPLPRRLAGPARATIAGAGDVVVMVGTRDSDAHATRRVDRMPNPWPMTVTRIVGRESDSVPEKLGTTRTPLVAGPDSSPARPPAPVPGRLRSKSRARVRRKWKSLRLRA